MLILGFALIALVLMIFLLSIWEERLIKQKEQESILNIPEGWQIISKGENFISMAEQDDIIWGGGRNGVFKFDRKTGEVLEKLDFCQEVVYVTSLLIDCDDKLWVSYEGGVVTWDGNKFEYFNQDNVLPDNRANYIMQDSQDRIWVGTWGGVAIFNGVSWTVMTEEDGLADNMVNIIFEDSYGGMWFGSYIIRDKAISVLKDNNWQYFTMETGLPNNNVTSILELKNNTVLVGTGFYNRGGAAGFVLQDGDWVLDFTLDENDGLAGEKVRSLYQDNLGNIWFGSEFDGIAIKDSKGNYTVITEEDGLSHDEVLSILQDMDGDLWLGTLDGITRLDETYLKSLQLDPFLK